MSNEILQNLVKSVDKHFEKTGVVLVGMHQEIQEQKQKLGQYSEKLASMKERLEETKNLSMTVEIDEKALSSLLCKFETIRQEFQNLSSNLTQLIEGRLKQQVSSIDDIRHEHNRILQKNQSQFQNTLDDTKNVFNRQLLALEEKITSHHDAHKHFFKMAFEELDKRRDALDAELLELKSQTKLFQEQQSVFIRKARNWTFLLILVSAAIISWAVIFTKGAS